jgi:mRNA interferase YafQ
MYEVDRSSKTFRRSVRRVAKRSYDMVKLEHTITLLAIGDLLPLNYKDHPLRGNYQGYRECHVEGEDDWLLIYQKDGVNLILTLTATGTHTDLFE